MISISDARGSGKTYKLLKIAFAENAIVLCANPAAMRRKAMDYGFEEDDLIFKHYTDRMYDTGTPVVIDEIQGYLNAVSNAKLIAYCDTPD